MAKAQDMALEALQRHLLNVQALSAQLALADPLDRAVQCLLTLRLDAAACMLADALADVEQACGLVGVPLPEAPVKPCTERGHCDTGGGRQKPRHHSLVEDDWKG